MSKMIKYPLIAIGILLLLLVGIAVAAPLLFDPNDYRAQISRLVKEKTGRELALGEIELKVFPWLRASAKGAVLGNAAGFGDQPFAEIGEASVGVKLLPLLLDRKVEVSTVALSGLKLNLAVDAQGRNNWADLSQPKAEEPEPKPEGESAFDLNSLDISGVEIESSSLAYSDARSGAGYRLENLNLETGTLKPNRPFDLKLGFTALSAKPDATADVTLQANVDPQLDQQRVNVKDLKLTLKGTGRKIAGGKDASADVELIGNAAMNLANKQLDVDGLDLKLKGNGLDMNADAALKAKIFADLGAQLFRVQGLALDANVAGSAIPGGKQPVKLKGDLEFDNQSGRMSFSNGQLQTAGLTLNTTIRGEGLKGESPKLSGPISIATFNPRPLLQQLGIKLETADPKALQQVSLGANYSGSFRSAMLNNLNLKLDQTSIQGSFGVRDFKTKALELGLKIDRIDADRYMPPKKPGQEKPVAAAGDKKFDDQTIPVEALQKLNANGSIDIGQLTVNGLKLSNVRLKLSGSPGAAQTQDISAQLYGGNVAVSNRLTPGAEPGYVFKTQLNALNAAPFLKDLIGKETVSGLGNLTVNLSSRGNTYGEAKRALNGDLAFRVENGAVKGFNLAQTVRKAQAALAGNLNYTETAPPQTDFSVFAASAKIINGVIKSDMLDGASPLFRVAGEGQFDLVNETINYLAKPTIVNTISGQGGKGLEQLKGITIPIRLSGNLYKPKVSLDLKAAMQQQATEKLRENLKDKEDELKAKLGEKLGVQTSKDGKPLGKDELKQELNNKLGDLLFGKQKKKEAAPAAPTTPAPPAEETPAPAAPAPAP